MGSRKEFTHRGTIRKTSLGWAWSEALRETPKYWVSAVQLASGKIVKYRKKDGKVVGGEDVLDLSTIRECR